MAESQDMLERLFAMQTELNDRIFIKKDIRGRDGETLKMEGLINEARAATESSAEGVGPNTDVNHWLNNYLTALDDESRELREELLWKWWSKDKLDMQNIRVEIVDQLHFWVSLALTAGMDANMVFKAYMQKNAINHQRQENDYSKHNKNEADNLAIKV